MYFTPTSSDITHRSHYSAKPANHQVFHISAQSKHWASTGATAVAGCYLQPHRKALSRLSLSPVNRLSEAELRRESAFGDVDFSASSVENHPRLMLSARSDAAESRVGLKFKWQVAEHSPRMPRMSPGTDALSQTNAMYDSIVDVKTTVDSRSHDRSRVKPNMEEIKICSYEHEKLTRNFFY